jgi:PAS domain S-box-containing protein
MSGHVLQPPATILQVGSGEPAPALTAALRAAGFTVAPAATGSDALRLAATNPDLVLLQLPLPDLDPAAVCRRLNVHPNNGPLILCVGGENLEELADACLSASTRPEDLVALVRALLRARRAEAALRRLHAELEEKVGKRIAELAEANSVLQATLDSIGDGVVATDAQGRVTFLNPIAQALTGWTATQARGRLLEEVFSIFNEQTRRPAPNLARRVLSEGVVVGLANHTVLIARDGTERPIDDCAAPIRDERGELRGVVLVFRDVTQERRAAQALAESETRFRGIFESANEGIWMLDEQARTTLVNPRMAEMLGYRPEEMVGRHKWDFLFVEDRPQFEALFERRRAGLSEHTDVRFRHRDGREVWTLMAARPVFGERGEFRGALDLFTDITERKRLDEELHRRAEELAEAGRRKDDFLALLGHELRNPLAPIRTAVSLLELKENDPAVVAEARDMIGRQAAQMTRLVDELLDAGRIARGKVQLRRERLDLGLLARSAAGDQRGNLEAAGLELAVQTPPGPVWVHGDAVRLTQVVGNLLDNALKSTAPGGRVTVRLAVADGWAALSVEDTGIGIPADALPKLFEAFSQVDAAPERTPGGLGLGLSVVKGLVELHGGRVEAASAGLGHGSRFTVRLPLDTASRERERPEVPPVGSSVADAPGSPPCKVLIIEDNRDAAESLRMLLDAYGHEVAVAYTGPEGIALARHFGPEVVICDLGLPGMSGYEVARVLRAQPGTSAALLVCVSGYGQEQDRSNAQEAGFDEALVKPVDPEVLVRLLARSRA